MTTTPDQPRESTQRTALRVNETRLYLYAPQAARDWWALFRAHGPAERYTITASVIVGDVVEVACEDRADAEDLRDLLTGHGVPRAALAIVGTRAGGGAR